ncbi:MAG: hypothetical protein AAFR87_33915 [Bacteroidota bacterium]
MHNLKDYEIAHMRDYLIQHGLSYEDVQDDVLDHLCCEVEDLLKEGKAFEEAFEEARKDFSPEEIATIQSDTLYYLTIKRTCIMIKGIFISAYLALALFAFSFGFDFLFGVALNDPATGNLLSGLCKFMGVSIFSFAFLPLFVLYGYKRFMKQLAT